MPRRAAARCAHATATTTAVSPTVAQVADAMVDRYRSRSPKRSPASCAMVANSATAISTIWASYERPRTARSITSACPQDDPGERHHAAARARRVPALRSRRRSSGCAEIAKRFIRRPPVGATRVRRRRATHCRGRLDQRRCRRCGWSRAGRGSPARLPAIALQASSTLAPSGSTNAHCEKPSRLAQARERDHAHAH